MSISDTYNEYFPRFALLAGILIGTATAIALLPVEYIADIANIIERSYLISQGASPLRWPDPPLRYLPISALMAVLVPAGLEPGTVVTAYMIAIEFVLIPVTLYRGVRAWYGAYAAGWAALLYGSLAFVLFPDVVPDASLVLINTMYSGVYWMYAFAIPPILFAWEQAGRGNYRLAGVGLGLVALIELPMAAIAAIVVAVTGLLDGEVRDVLEAAAVSIVVSLPLVPFAVYHLDYWISSGAGRTDVSRYPLFDGGSQSFAGFEVTVLEARIAGVVLFAMALATVASAYYRSDAVKRFVQELPAAVKSQLVVLVVLELVLGVMLLALWYHILISYIFRFTLFALGGVIASRAVSAWRSADGRDRAAGGLAPEKGD